MHGKLIVQAYLSIGRYFEQIPVFEELLSWDDDRRRITCVVALFDSMPEDLERDIEIVHFGRGTSVGGGLALFITFRPGPKTVFEYDVLAVHE